MDVLLARPPLDFWDPLKEDREPVCEGVAVDESRVPAAANAFAPERFIPYGALAGTCPAEVEAYASPDRPLAASRAHLAAAWSRLADGIVIITLREAAGRRARLAEELRLAGIVPENADRTLWYVADRPRQDFPGVRGRFGCMRSHVAVTVEAERRGWKRWVVFEDDAVFVAELSAGALHNVADALDAEPGMALVSLGSSLAVCDDGPHAARGVFPIRVGSGTACLVCTPVFTNALRAGREIYGDPAERREGEAVFGSNVAADVVFFNTDMVKRHGNVSQVLPVVVSQAGQTQIGYGTMDKGRIGAWFVRKAGLNPAIQRASDPRVRTAAANAAIFASLSTAAAIALVALLVAGGLAVTRRRRRKSVGLASAAKPTRKQ
jgi:hypothetical protein